MSYENPWTFIGIPYEEVMKDHIGFVYIITNKLTGRRYLGKKNFFFSKTKQVKGKKKRFKAESDWKTYYGSSAELQEDIDKFGKEHFKRDIIRLCRSKAEFSYYEAKFQFEYNVLESDDWYNGWISVRIRKSHLKKLFA